MGPQGIEYRNTGYYSMVPAKEAEISSVLKHYWAPKGTCSKYPHTCIRMYPYPMLLQLHLQIFQTSYFSLLLL